MRKLCLAAVLIFLFAGCSREYSAPAAAGAVTYTALTNPNASAETVNLYNYIQRINKTKILSGQQESVLKYDPVTHEINAEYEMDYIFGVTGKYPAIRGLDFINDDFGGVVTRARGWHDRGGIVSIFWHWGTPPHGKGYESSKNNPDTIFQNPNWWRDLYDEKTDLNKGFTEMMNRAADALLELQEEKIPVLWTPFHEFDGGWYWWSTGGSAEFIKLWRHIYDYFTNVKKLNNLIWVLGYSRDVRSGWNPGREYYDIAGMANFTEVQSGTTSESFGKVKEAVEDAEMTGDYAGIVTPIALVQCGKIPGIEEIEKRSGKSRPADWAYFINRHTSGLTENNPPADLKKVYTSSYVITLDELPADYF